jgi:hypothetical protein
MRTLQLSGSTSATPSAAGLLLDRRTFIGGLGRGLAMTVLATAASEGWTVLRITEGEIDVNGKKGKAYAIRQADGTAGYVGTRGQRFKVVLQNQTKEPLAIHWHGILLPNGRTACPM